MMDRNYKGIIFTDHALERLAERGIKQGDAWATLVNPQQSRHGSNKNAWVFYRDYGQDRIEVVANQNENKEWVVLSVWSRPTFGRPYKTSNPTFLENLVEKIMQKLFGRLRKK